MKKVYIIFFVLLCAFLATFFGLVFAKYIKQEQFNHTLTVSAQLGTIALQEHKAVRLDDGSYELDMGELIYEDSGNSYNLLPGVDVPKDPYITIDKNSDLLPVFMYLKVESSIENESIQYVIDDENWLLISGPTDVSGVTTSYYVYAKDGVAKEVTSSIDEPINIIKNQTITVGCELLSGKIESQQLRFTAAMFQTISGDDAEDVFDKNRGIW